MSQRETGLRIMHSPFFYLCEMIYLMNTDEVLMMLLLSFDDTLEDRCFDQGADAAKNESAQKTDVTCVHTADNAKEREKYSGAKNSFFNLDRHRGGQYGYNCADEIDQLIPYSDVGKKRCICYKSGFIVFLIICVHNESPCCK